MGDHGENRYRYRDRGLTLLEMVVTLAITSLIVAGIGSVMMIAGKALPQDAGAARQVADAGRVADRIASELRYAVSFSEWTGSAVTFTVADRDNDAVPETIRYAWSGTPGDPLTRRYNGGNAIVVLDNVRQFTLGYDLRSTSEQVEGTPVESNELVLAGYPTANSPADFSINSTNWIGQFFQPALPPNVSSWRVTRVMFLAMARGGQSGQTLVQLRPADASQLPAETVLEQVPLDEINLSPDFYEWQDIPFAGVSGLSPGDGLCLVLQWVVDKHSAKIQYDTAGSDRLVTTDGGISWVNNGAQSMVYYVFGTYMMPGPMQTITKQYLTGVRIILQADDATASALETAVAVLNVPQVSGP